MSCLGIDIGLKTLALCVIKDSKILLWDVYNVLDEDLCCETCSRKAKYSFDKKYLCGIHSRKIKDKKPIKTKKVSSYSLHEITTRIINKLEEIVANNSIIIEGISSVIIELQPKVNHKMKFTSHVIFTMFTYLYKDKKCSIKFERASVKLKKIKFEERIPNTYKNRKKRAVDYTLGCLEKGIISNSCDYEDMLSAKTKLDDLSDAFLLSYNNSKRST